MNAEKLLKAVEDWQEDRLNDHQIVELIKIDYLAYDEYDGWYFTEKGERAIKRAAGFEDLSLLR